MDSLPAYNANAGKNTVPLRKVIQSWRFQKSLHITNPAAQMALSALYVLGAVFIVIAVHHLTSIRDDEDLSGGLEHAGTPSSSASIRRSDRHMMMAAGSDGNTVRSQQTTTPGTGNDAASGGPAVRLTVPATCDGTPFILLCPEGHVITGIEAGFYGRSDSSVCPHDKETTTNTKCSLANAADEMLKECVGRGSCAPPGARGYSSDPCPGTFKYASATYLCSIIAT